jgi:toxin ParE1/3/4
VRRAISETITLLEDYPRAGRESTISGVRVIGVVRYGYLIYHKAGEDEVVVLHIRHAARRAPEADEL